MVSQKGARTERQHRKSATRYSFNNSRNSLTFGVSPLAGMETIRRRIPIVHSPIVQPRQRKVHGKLVGNDRELVAVEFWKVGDSHIQLLPLVDQPHHLRQQVAVG